MLTENHLAGKSSLSKEQIPSKPYTGSQVLLALGVSYAVPTQCPGTNNFWFTFIYHKINSSLEQKSPFQ